MHKAKSELLETACDCNAARVFIPIEFRGRLIKTFGLSVRLGNVFGQKNIHLAGELHGLLYEDLLKWKNCGQRTVAEFQKLVRKMQSGDEGSASPETKPAPATVSLLSVPSQARELKLSELPVSVRLENVLRLRGYQSLGNVHGVDVQDLKKLDRCGIKSILELREIIRRASEGEFSASGSNDLPANLREAASAIDCGFGRLSKRDRKIYEARLFGNNGKPRILKDVAPSFRMTPERVRQIVTVIKEKLRREGGPKLEQALKVIANECERCVCPLTPELFALWLGNGKAPSHSPQFYVCVLDHIDQTIPIWPPGSIRNGGNDLRAVPIENALETLMRSTGKRVTVAQAYLELRQQPEHQKMSVGNFLGALRKARRIIVVFPAPDRPELQLRRMKMHPREFALTVLENSPMPLTFEEIVKQAIILYGDEAITVYGCGVVNSLTPDKGFYHLGRGTLGVQKHFHTPASRRLDFCDQFNKILHLENRPVSTIEAANQKRIKGFEQTNTYEMAQILREDKRFKDLGRRLFALVEWGMQKREYIKDLVPKILAKANRVLTSEQISEQLSRLRSVTPDGLSNFLHTSPLIRSYGFGYYGLRNWGLSQKEVILSDHDAIERAVRLAKSPMNFGTLCENLGVSIEGKEADILWKTCAGSSRLRRLPEKKTPATLFLHKGRLRSRSRQAPPERTVPGH
jgi:hypothetical protein